MQCSAVQWSAVQCSAVQCSAVQCSVVQCSAVQCSAVQYSSLLCSAVQCNTNAMQEQSVWLQVQWQTCPYRELCGRLSMKCSGTSAVNYIYTIYRLLLPYFCMSVLQYFTLDRLLPTKIFLTQKEDLGKRPKKKKIQNVNFFQKGGGGAAPKAYIFFKVYTKSK